ncbi:hypothetical protein METBIDRAFT_29337 [Metschnikowia bicuspidata var. bicuspidata NRRL YB-4993]|uniref:Uncharacterized protein n=1 Tax=Metschnikowia bicuspidata var. bicuspidata NRRL YB-4993 TaxID=869754 RepID=A0A1A0HFH7_9ASCO|nr:hypothetical protein METBIDRAFT_29337 [Metschnikowia bicuspidata var. bicuspidata NRRL YB-4993]OBA22740.1 hypothetical protein METBIDRAFT_29337 [Metschnikowia bicuspidata var. bicuspidata NRRL YB-4993]
MKLFTALSFVALVLAAPRRVTVGRLAIRDVNSDPDIPDEYFVVLDENAIFLVQESPFNFKFLEGYVTAEVGKEQKYMGINEKNKLALVENKMGLKIVGGFLKMGDESVFQLCSDNTLALGSDCDVKQIIQIKFVPDSW